MGEYAKYQGEHVKIGTCEDLYYLRFDQAHLVTAEANSLDPMDREIWPVLRFRFPFPDEDHIGPGGNFEDHDRGLRIPGWSFPDGFDFEHYSVQLTAIGPGRPGYVMSVPCPEQYGQPGMSVELLTAEDVDGAVSALRAIHASNTDGIAERLARLGRVSIGRNGFNGGPKLVQQGWRDGQLRIIAKCGACGGRANLPADVAATVAEAFIDEAEVMEWTGPGCTERTYRHSDDTRRRYAEIARRILAGYEAVMPA